MPGHGEGVQSVVMGTKVLIVGGGVAGLATARAIRRHAVHADVVERAGRPSRAGAGVYLPANAVRAIGELGLGEELAACGQRISRQRFLDHRGRTLFEVDLADFWGATGPCLALGHSELHELLGSGLPVSAGRTITALHEFRGRRSRFADRADRGRPGGTPRVVLGVRGAGPFHDPGAPVPPAPTSRPSKRSSGSRGPEGGSCSSATPPTRCPPTWPRASAWPSRTASSWPRPSRPGYRWQSSRHGAGPASRRCRPRPTAAIARAACRLSGATRY